MAYQSAAPTPRATRGKWPPRMRVRRVSRAPFGGSGQIRVAPVYQGLVTAGSNGRSRPRPYARSVAREASNYLGRTSTPSPDWGDRLGLEVDFRGHEFNSEGSAPAPTS